ncbi:MAG: Eco57I restriction-modification methylase domain-containing protein [Kiritimatiellae bacterium]|nr:Eco57I restriction-modification methylase domain-containing protein [Kiritimatiellia bacterium]
MNKQRVKESLQKGDFQSLFLDDLGWDSASGTLPVSLNGHDFHLTAVAEKRGVVCYTCSLDSGLMTGHTTLLRQIERNVEKSVHEHVLIFTDNKNTQIWQWTRREPNRPILFREYRYSIGESPEPLFQKLRHLVFTLDEEDNLTHVDVLKRFQEAGVYADQVTRSFYDRYKKEHEDFMEFIEGIPTEDLARWYTSVMLNRLIFIYFIQEKDFLDANHNYLRDKLAESQKRGKDRYFQDFLCPLFFEGFAKPEADRSQTIVQLLGRIPYLNGGIFEKHEIERAHGKTIRIEDKAFEKIFAFFKEYRWHLDERPLRNADEINPDVLGYIFEKYTNQKQMGAYYTKEDITDYIARNTIIPRLLDKARYQYPPAFEGKESVWRLLAKASDRYIFSEVRHGSTLTLPKDIALGIKDNTKQSGWNKVAPAEFGLPTETWREVIARRQRCEDIIKTLSSGKVTSTNDLITLNLNIRLFTQDVISECEDPELLSAMWQAITSITVLDPTCGSGAFLFAALNTLQPLYATCLDRMQMFLNEGAGKKDHSKYSKLFSDTLKKIADHPNEDYFTFKTIIINNLFGVDLMKEATEICRLRLFLKLIAQVDSVDQIEPLPDIDFNIRAGNSLVGFASREHAKQLIQQDITGQGKLQFSDALEVIEQKCQMLENVLTRWRKLQEDNKNTADQKRDYRDGLKDLKAELDRYLADEYGIDIRKATAFDKWRETHEPFHWFIEFYSLMRQGGFDVIVGNPPYIAVAKIKKEYKVHGYQTKECTDIYAWVLERVLSLTTDGGRSGMIVPLSLGFSGDFDSCRKMLFKDYGANWFSSYGRIPSALFNYDVRVRNTIHIGYKTVDRVGNYTSRLHRWFEQARSTLFSDLSYAAFTPDLWQYRIPKLNTTRLARAFETCLCDSKQGLNAVVSPRRTQAVLHFKKTAYNWLNFCRELPPCYDDKGKRVAHTQFGEMYFQDETTRDVVFHLANGKLMFIFWCAVADDFHVTAWNITDFPVSLRTISQKDINTLGSMSSRLQKAMFNAVQFKLNAGRKVGNYNLAKCRTETDESDSLFANLMGISEVWDDIELYYAQVVRTDFGEDE